MAHRDDIVDYANELLETHRFPEYGRPGLQVLGADEVAKIACGVSASLELFRRAAAAGAQLVIVHHGMFWRNEPLWIDRRQRGRLEALFAADLTLLAYHLPLDAHPVLGNNALLAEALGVEVERPFGEVGQGGRLRNPAGLDEVVARIEAVTADDIQRVLARVLGNAPRTLAVVGPHEESEFSAYAVETPKGAAG